MYVKCIACIINEYAVHYILRMHMKRNTGIVNIHDVRERERKTSVERRSGERERGRDK